ncbi:MAG TPA: hypothetical protein VFK65_11695 [Candidatus Binatia bacterium]|nr:hypothetical protein [Candidatus Binatia bacterium]
MNNLQKIISKSNPRIVAAPMLRLLAMNGVPRGLLPSAILCFWAPRTQLKVRASTAASA